jgi:SAM-dependent methyltransferase
VTLLFSPGFLEILEQIRDDELRCMIPSLGPTGRLLEIGAGSGWQAKRLVDHGFSVDAIDVGASEYRHARVWQVSEYDGHHIPFPDASFDVVFSSNVFEHMAHVSAFQREVLRVLRPGGIAVHSMPSVTWRLLTSIEFYPWVCAQLARRIAGARTRPTTDSHSSQDHPSLPRPHRRWLSRLRVLIAAPVHGETGTMIGEFWYFSRFRWKSLFVESGFAGVRATPLGLFYSGYFLLGSQLPIRARRWLARVGSSSCIAYSMRKTGSPD